MSYQSGFFDIEERYAFLSKSGDPLEKLNAVMDWEIFRNDLDKALKRSDRTKGGRPPFDAVLMFKVLVIQTLYNMSDDQAEFVINDRLSFMRFLGLHIGSKVPDAKTIWLFQEKLSEAGALEDLLHCFDRHLRRCGYLAMEGQIVDATLVSSPKQRNTKEEKAQIKAGKTAHEISFH